jgi:hypothetical protein
MMFVTVMSVSVVTQLTGLVRNVTVMSHRRIMSATANIRPKPVVMVTSSLPNLLTIRFVASVRLVRLVPVI